MARDDSRRGGAGRPLGLGLLAVLALVLIAYLGKCLPGFGTGGAPSSGPTSPEAPAKQETPAKPDEEAGDRATTFAVRGDQCAHGEEAAVSCEALCGSLPGSHDVARPVVIHAAHGTHAAVERLRECLVAAGFADVTVRGE